ncbi:MAG: hypothetical protein WDZ83_14580 [Rhizobiaceae bacterium]
MHLYNITTNREAILHLFRAQRDLTGFNEPSRDVYRALPQELNATTASVNALPCTPVETLAVAAYGNGGGNGVAYRFMVWRMDGSVNRRMRSIVTRNGF